ncbi:MAG: glycosyltransferase [Chromatiales bacterium]|nr:glycosyltransferase [Chromatiales bacterium]
MSEPTLLIAVTSHNNLSLRGTVSLERTLDSIRTARELLRRELPIRVALSWVDDGSDDGTPAWLARRLREERDEWFLHNAVNRFAGAARNQATARIDADVIALFDSDDEMYPEHLLVGWQALNTPDASGRLPGWAISRCDFGGCEDVHPAWAERIANSSPCTKFFRRRVWEFIEGMPDACVYRITTEEDSDATRLAATFFEPAIIGRSTLRYWSYPGSHFDRQSTKFRLPPDEAPREDLSPRQRAAFELRDRLFDARVRYLKDKLERLLDPRSFDDLMTNFRVGGGDVADDV